MQQAQLHRAAGGVRAALLAGEALALPLQWLAEAAGAEAVLLVRDTSERVQEISCSPSAMEATLDYLAGRRPPDSRAHRVQLSLQNGFLGDYDSFRPEEIARDAYYQEFLRGYGVGWHAAALLAQEGSCQTTLSFKRRFKDGHFDRDELDGLNAILPHLRETASFAHALGLAEIAGAARGGTTYLLDGLLRCAMPGAVEPVPGSNAAVIFRDGVPEAAEASERAHFHGALLRASQPPFAIQTLLLTAPQGGERSIVRLASSAGSALSLFHATRVVMIVTPVEAEREPGDMIVPALIDDFKLTPAEARAAALVGSGWLPAHAARRLGISEGTLRNQLKAAYAKLGVTRQAHLTRIVNALDMQHRR